MAGQRSSGDVLSRRQLNRATLARKMLLQRQDMSGYDAIERLIGLQSQVPNVPYLALWSRLAPFDPAEISELMRRRKVVRAALMRPRCRTRSLDARHDGHHGGRARSGAC